MKTIRVTLAFEQTHKGTTTMGKLIQWWTKSKFYHVEIVLDDVWVSSRYGEGVHMLPLRAFNNAYQYHHVGIIELTDTQYDTLFNWLEEQTTKKYDTLGIIYSQFFPFRYDDKNKWFCSELITKVLTLLGVQDTFDLTPNLVSPGDLAKLFNIE